ncbi:hypothetical protein PENTCL1PPCAC_472 [Pristionchus entomophagus]|uniref:C6 domain-containing protein n=1 Tax=Pristionchus entomophagus TaxID=358040 RepID=A0AAV5S6D7_9BILA|nr:hypothetical protein PENTCL1PPCAC_472 [Pristionchus entomophagus]
MCAEPPSLPGPISDASYVVTDDPNGCSCAMMEAHSGPTGAVSPPIIMSALLFSTLIASFIKSSESCLATPEIGRPACCCCPKDIIRVDPVSPSGKPFGYTIEDNTSEGCATIYYDCTGTNANIEVNGNGGVVVYDPISAVLEVTCNSAGTAWVTDGSYTGSVDIEITQLECAYA